MKYSDAIVFEYPGKRSDLHIINSRIEKDRLRRRTVEKRERERTSDTEVLSGDCESEFDITEILDAPDNEDFDKTELI